MPKQRHRLIAILFQSGLAWCLGGLVFFIGGALFVASQQSGETNIKELLMGLVDEDSVARAKQKEFWDRNPNLEFIRRYNRTSMTEVRVRDSSSQIAVLDREILDGVRIQTSSCEGTRMFTPAEIYPGATDLVCFTLEKPNDAGGDYQYRFAASFSAPAKATPVGAFYQELIRARGMHVRTLDNGIDLQTVEGEGPEPGFVTVVRVAILSFGRTTSLFLAASDAFVVQRPASGT